MKQRILLPFGAGLDRGTGTYLLEPSSFADLRNVHLGQGRVRVRRGVAARGGGIQNATDILAVSPIRGTRRSIVVAYSSVTRQAWLVTATIDPTTLAVTLTPVPGGTLWTLNAQAPFPRVVITDSFGRAFIAHDEPVYGYRQPTKVYNQSTNTVADLTLQGGSVPMPLRGVARHLQYMLGWGYGFDTPTEQRNRAEALRFSLPGDPATFDANWYMLLGQRGEPIVGGGALRSGFVAAKENELHLVVGTNPSTFDSLVIDPYFGQVSANAGIVVGDTYFFWSSEGPRATNGGESAALGDTELDLWGEVPDDILAATDFRSAFAAYRPEENEIEWCFPAPGRNATWSYAIHLDDAPGQGRRWTYRPYSAVLRCAGMLQGNTATDPADPLSAPYPVATSLTRAAQSWYTHTFQWNNLNVGALPPGAVAEVWVAYGPSLGLLSSGWSKIAEANVAGAGQSVTANVGSPRALGARLLFASGGTSLAVTTDLDRTGGIPSESANAVSAAVRYRLADGSCYSGYTSANPLDWPSQARATATKDAVNNGPGILARGTGLGFAWQPEGSGIIDDNTAFSVTWQNLNPASLEAGSVVEVWIYGTDGNLDNSFVIGNGVGPNGWTLARVVAPSGTTQTEGGLRIAGRTKLWALRIRHGGFTGADRFFTGNRANGDWGIDNRFFNDAQQGAAGLAQVPDPFPRITSAAGNTINITFENRLSAPPGQYSVQILRLSQAPYAFAGGVPLYQYTTSNAIAETSPGSGVIPATYAYVDPSPRLAAVRYYVRLLRDGNPISAAWMDPLSASWPQNAQVTLT